MIRGLYTSGLGMTTQMKRLDVISNNLANVNTSGYKKDDAIVSSFPEMLMTRINDTKNINGAINNHDYNNIKIPVPIGKVTLGVQVDEIYTNFTQGSFIRTDEKFNLAIQGEGFFVINTPGGEERFSRDGSFVVDINGQLKTQEGNLVMGDEGVITLDEDYLTQVHEVFVDDIGTIIIDGEYIDTIRMVSFEDNNSLKKIGDNLYEGTDTPTPFEGKILQGYVEGSNVNPVAAMVDMITVSRTYEANQKMIQVHDSLMGKAVNEIGKA